MNHPDNTEKTSPEEVEEERDDVVIVMALRWSLTVFLILAAVGGGLAFWWTDVEPPAAKAPTKLTLPEVRETSAVTIPQLLFTDITQQAGIAFVHENGATGDKLLPETMGGGCAFFDYDNDSDQDILLINSQSWPWDKSTTPGIAATLALYQNDGQGQFTNVTAGSGLDVSLYGMGVAVGDYDNDGHTDVFVSALGGNRLFRNTEGKFVDVTQQAQVAGGPDTWSTSCGWFDYDNDGDLDLFVCNYVEWSREFDSAQKFQLIGGGRAYGRPQVFAGTYPYLYQNEGNGQFRNVSEEAGVQIDNPATGRPMAKSLGLSLVDFDEDGWMDVMVSNDTVQNFLFHNQGNGRFQEIGAIAGVAFDSMGNARGAMGIDTARFRNSGEFGVAIGNFSNEMTALYVSRTNDLQFVDEAVSAGLGPKTRLELTFGLFFFDCDLDGRLDLLAANGHLEEDINKVQASQHYEQSPQLFWNSGPTSSDEFLPVPVELCGEDFVRPMVGRGASYADIDGDGDLDILIVASGRPARLLRNDQTSGHHWLRLQLVGSVSNRNAIGAWVTVDLADRQLQAQVMPTRSYLSQTELPITFGLDGETEVKQITVHWPNGDEQVIKDVKIDTLTTFEQK